MCMSQFFGLKWGLFSQSCPVKSQRLVIHSLYLNNTEYPSLLSCKLWYRLQDLKWWTWKLTKSSPRLFLKDYISLTWLLTKPSTPVPVYWVTSMYSQHAVSNVYWRLLHSVYCCVQASSIKTASSTSHTSFHWNLQVWHCYQHRFWFSTIL